jgi:hypothetical protein
VTKGFKWHLSHAIEGRATYPPRKLLTRLNDGYENGGPAHPAKPPNYQAVELFSKERLLRSGRLQFLLGITQDVEVVATDVQLQMIAAIYLFSRSKVVAISPQANQNPLAVF